MVANTKTENTDKQQFRGELTLKEASELLGVHVTTLWKWRTYGVRGKKLCVIRRGGTVRISLQAIRDFQEVVNAPPPPPAPVHQASPEILAYARACGLTVD